MGLRWQARDFRSTVTRLSVALLPLREHTDYARLEDMFQAWRKEQRVLYDKLSAERTSSGTPHATEP